MKINTKITLTFKVFSANAHTQYTTHPSRYSIENDAHQNFIIHT